MALPGKTTYSAGTAFLTVVPSFLGIEKAFNDQVRDMAASADKNLAAGMAKGLQQVNKQAKSSGAQSGKDYAGAYETEARKALTKAWQNLPEPQPGVNMSNWDKKLAQVREDMKALGQQRIGIDIDHATFDQAIADFKKRLEDLRDSAAGPNKELGFFNADQAAKELRAFQDFEDEVTMRARAGGEQAGSAFNDRMAKTLRDGISKIPRIVLTADSTDAERKLADLRARMVDLSDKRIGIDIDAGTAYAEIKAIAEELKALDRRSVRVDIRTNAHDAAAEFTPLIQQAEAAGQSVEGIGTRSNFSLSRLEYLIALGASLGTVIVPAAAAAAGAIGTIGTMALGAVTGIGVAALALSGVSDAVKALNQYQSDQAKSAKSIDDANRSVASSTDQVRSATMALANTRRNVADAAQDAARRVADAEQGVADARRQAAQEAKNAAQEVADARKQVTDAVADLADARRQAVIDETEADRQVRDAQRGVTDAEKDAIDVRTALTQAINDAKDSMLELDVQIKRNEQDQSVAVTAQMKALDELNKLKTNPRATEVELRQAQDAYNEQTVRLEELGVKHKELAEQQAKYAKDGVEADDQVIAARKRIADADQKVADARDRLSREQAQRTEAEYRAQKRIADAQDRVAKAQQTAARAQEAQRAAEIRGQEQVAKAQQQVADARRQQQRQAQDGQYQLAQASQAVTAAQRAQQAAWQKTATAGGDALDTLNQKMASLSPAQQHFAKFLFGLKDDLLQLRAAAAEPFLPQAETAVTGLLKYLPGVERFISKVADGLGHIAIQAVDALGNPVWQRFFGYIDDTAVPSMQQLFEVGENVAQGLISLFLALTPFNKPVGEGLVEMTKDFAEWADRLDKTQGYRDFLAYVQENGPRVVHFIGEIGQLLIALVKASAPLGSIVLRVLSALVDVINSIPTPVLTVLVSTIGLVSLGFTGLGAVMRALKFKDQITEIFGPRAQALVEKFAIDTGRATDQTGRLGKATATVAGITAAARDKVSGYAQAVGSLPGRVTNAVTSSNLFYRSMDLVRDTSSKVAGAVSGVSGAVQSVGPRLVSFGNNAQTAAKSGIERLKLSMLEVVDAANGPGGISAGVQVAGSKVSDLTSKVTTAASLLGGKISSGAGTFASALGNVATKAGAAATAVGTKLLKAGSSLISLMGGPWGVALIAATAAVGYFTGKSIEQKQKVETLKTTLGELSTAYQDLAQHGDQAGESANETFRNIVRNNPELQKAVIQLDHLGISFDEMVKAASSGDPSAVLKKLNTEIERNTQLSDEFDRRNAAAKGIYGANPYTEKIKGLKEVRDAFVANADAMGQANQATEILNDSSERNQLITAAQARVTQTGVGAQIDLVDAYDRNAASIAALNGLVSTFSNLQSTAKQRADAMRVAIDDQTSAAINQSEADETLAQKTLALRDQVNQAKAAHDANARSLDLNSQTSLRNRDAVEEVAKSIREMYLQDIAAGKPLADVTKAHNARIAALKEEAKRLGLDKTETDKLIAAYGDVPTDVKTTISMDPNSFKNVYTNLQRLQFMQQMLKLGVNADEAEKQWKQSQSDMNRAIAHGYAGGGPITGPGTATSDSVLMWGSDGEYVHRAAAVDYYGEQAMAALNDMQVPRENLAGYADGGLIPRQRGPVPAYASGGKVKTQTWPMPTDVSQSWVPTAAWVRANTPIAGASDGSWAGVLSPNKTVAKMQQFALAQRGKRYLWAAVGPDRYDCSGLTGDLWAIATGHPLYHRYMSTSDMGPGRHNMVAGPGKYWTVYLGPGHTASNIAGLHAEAYGGNGVPLAIGRIGTRLSYYTQKLHLPGFAEGGPVDPKKLTTRQDRMVSFLRYGWPEPPPGSGLDTLLNSAMATGTFDIGGLLPPGYSTVFNGTGQPEAVLNAQQWRDISDLARGQATGRGGNTYQFEFRDTTLTPAQLKAIQDREAALARVGRAG